MAGKLRSLSGICALLFAAAPLGAIPLPEPAPRYHWECVPFARAVSGIQIYGDAWTWWDQAEGRYQRGKTPRVGAVMAFIPRGRMQLGHVATVSEIIDERTLLITHANWSPINGRRGQIEKNVQAVDVSANNDWSQVRVWYGPIKALGGRRWALNGFIYNKKPGLIDDVETSTDKPARKLKAVKSFATTAKVLKADSAGKSSRKGLISADLGSDPIGQIIAAKRRIKR